MTFFTLISVGEVLSLCFWHVMKGLWLVVASEASNRRACWLIQSRETGALGCNSILGRRVRCFENLTTKLWSPLMLALTFLIANQ